MKPKILLVDNQLDYLDTLSRLFDLHGFQVLTASSPTEAQDIFENKWFHIALIDVRLEDDSNPNDVSGLLLARDLRFNQIPKIVATHWPTWQAAVKALTNLESVSGHPPAVDYVSKDIKFEALLETVTRALSQNARINWKLSLDWHGCDKFSLLNWIEPDCKNHLLVERAEELEDLFRRLFYEKKMIKLDKLIWHDKKRVSLMVTAFDNNDLRETFAVTCGPRLGILDEASHYREFAPTSTSNIRTSLTYSAEVNHFAANAYTLAGATADEVQLLADIYVANPGSVFNSALEDLFKSTLMSWGGGSFVLKKKATPKELYLEWLDLDEEELFSGYLVEKLYLLATELQRINIEVDFRLDSLSIKYGMESFGYPDPINIIAHCHKSHKDALFIRTPGRCTAKNILVNESGHTWVTDFAYAGLALSYWNCVEIEAEIRFDWTAKCSIQSLHEFEQALVKERFSKFNLNDFEIPLRKPMKAIVSVRRLALPLIGKNAISYHTGILFQALSRVMTFNAPEAVRMSDSELTRVGHAFIAILIIGDHLLKNSAAGGLQNAKENIRIDVNNREVWLGSTCIRLQPRSFEILYILYNKSDQLCSRAELIERVFKEKYNENDESQVNRLNSAIFRLRQQLEMDPDKPQYILTSPKGGYKLNSRH